MLNEIQQLLKGRKTYILGLVLVIIGVAEGVLGVDVPQVDVDENWIQWVLNGMIAGSIRAGIDKTKGA